jgi:hypothetical protein
MRTMIEIRSALITNIKAIVSLTMFHENFPVEVRELNWKGNDFKYPCVRVGQLVLTPMNETCSAHKVDGSIMCFSELPSSLEADTISDIIFQALHGHSFSVGVVKFAMFRCQQFEAVAVEESNVWQSTIKWSATVS